MRVSKHALWLDPIAGRGDYQLRRCGHNRDRTYNGACGFSRAARPADTPFQLSVSTRPWLTTAESSRKSRPCEPDGQITRSEMSGASSSAPTPTHMRSCRHKPHSRSASSASRHPCHRCIDQVGRQWIAEKTFPEASNYRILYDRHVRANSILASRDALRGHLLVVIVVMGFRRRGAPRSSTRRPCRFPRGTFSRDAYDCFS